MAEARRVCGKASGVGGCATRVRAHERPRSSVGKPTVLPGTVCHSSIMGYTLRPLFQDRPESVGK